MFNAIDCKGRSYGNPFSCDALHRGYFLSFRFFFSGFALHFVIPAQAGTQ